MLVAILGMVPVCALNVLLIDVLINYQVDTQFLRDYLPCFVEDTSVLEMLLGTFDCSFLNATRYSATLISLLLQVTSLIAVVLLMLQMK